MNLSDEATQLFLIFSCTLVIFAIVIISASGKGDSLPVRPPNIFDKFVLDVEEGIHEGKKLTTIRIIPNKYIINKEDCSFMIRGDFSGLENFGLKITGPDGDIITEIYERK